MGDLDIVTCGDDGLGRRRRWPSFWCSCRCGRLASRSSGITRSTQARKQSKLYAPQVAKHLKEGRLKDALARLQAKTYQYSHLAKVVLAGLQEYQFQQDAGGTMSVTTSSTRCAAPFSARPR